MTVDWDARAASVAAGARARAKMQHDRSVARREQDEARRASLTVRINITDGDGVILGQLTMTGAELHAARRSAPAAVALVDDIASQAGVH